MAARHQQVRCTIHNLEFGFDAERVRALGVEPALMECPMCSRARVHETEERLQEVTEHRDLLLKAIDLKKLVSRPR